MPVASDTVASDTAARTEAVLQAWRAEHPGHHALVLVDEQRAAGRLLVANEPKHARAPSRPYLRILGTSATGLEVTVFLDLTRLTVARVALKSVAAGVPGIGWNGKGEVTAPVSDLDLCRRVIDAVFAA